MRCNILWFVGKICLIKLLFLAVDKVTGTRSMFCMFGAQGQGLAVIFSHHQLPLVCVKKKKGGHVLGSKVKVEFRHLFFRFENGLVFGLPIKLMQISMFFC